MSKNAFLSPVFALHQKDLKFSIRRNGIIDMSVLHNFQKSVKSTKLSGFIEISIVHLKVTVLFGLNISIRINN